MARFLFAAAEPGENLIYRLRDLVGGVHRVHVVGVGNDQREFVEHDGVEIKTCDEAGDRRSIAISEEVVCDCRLAYSV